MASANKRLNGGKRGATIRSAIERLELRQLLSFSAPVSYTIGTQADGFVPNAAPIGVITADFNADLKADVVVAHKADNSIHFLKGNGNGTFQSAVSTAIGQSIQGDVFAGDFNHDGKIDLFLPSAGNQPIIMLGRGDGTFKPAIVSSSFAYSGYYPRGWAVGDFNKDGNLDVVCTLPSNSSNTGRYMVLLGNGDGTFKTGIVGPAVLGYSRWVTTGDFNKDGKLDLATADGQGTSGSVGNVEMTILLGNGDGTFNLGAHYASPQLPDGSNTAATANPEDLVVADVNKDGKLDAIESDYDNTINVFLGNGDGTFKAARSFNPGNYPRDVVPADVNHDGKIDLVVTNVGINQGGALFSSEGAEPGSVAVLLGNGDGTFAAPVTYSPSVYPGWTAVGDFNNDSFPDLATTQVLDGHSIKVMLNQPTSNNQPPVFSSSPSASPNPTTNNTTVLSALGSDDGGEPGLTYTWATVGSIPGPVTYSVNDTNAAKKTTVKFTTPGTYLFECAVTDAQGLSIMDLVTVSVNATTSLPAPVASSPGTSSSPGPLLTTWSPTFKWQGITGTSFTGYQINISDLTSKTSVSYTVGASVTTFTPSSPLAVGHQFAWNVRALDGSQTGPASTSLYFQTPALPQPVILVVGSSVQPGPVITTLTPTLTWQAVTGVKFDSYQINLFDLTASTLVSIQVSPTASSYQIPAGALTAGHDYVWNLRLKVGSTLGPESSTYLYFQAE